MAFIQTNIFSNVLAISTSFNMIIPENKHSEKPKVLYLLHGLSDDHTIWARRTSVERYAADYNLAVVMPTTHRGFYTDMKIGYNYFTFISKELPAFVENVFNISTERDDTFVAGLSMGGYGAVKLALRCPEKFSKVASMSGAVDIVNMDKSILPEASSVFGEKVDDENDLIKLLELQKDNPLRPKIFQCCGTEDFLYKNNQNFKNCAESYGYDLTYTESKGDHNWAYWDARIQDVIKWLFN